MPKRKQNAPEKSPFSMKLALLRKEKGLKMDSLAQAVGVSKSYISLLESGGRQPSRDVVLKLAGALSQQNPEQVRDELLILAGFAPVNTRAISAYQDAIQIYEQSLLSDPNNFQLFSRLILALIKTGRQEQAQEQIQQGLQHFTEMVQLQFLLAQLELSKGHFQAAILNMQTALQHFEQNPVQVPTHLRHADLIFNLGTIYFIQGHSLMGKAIHNRETFQQVLEAFATASDYFQQALTETPEDIYMLDEYARLLFNRAYLLNNPNAWQDTIAIYRRLLIQPHKHELGPQPLMESASFLAHAYTKSGAFDEAELTLGLLSAFNPDYWLVHYLQACLQAQRYAHSNQKNDLHSALQALERALELDPQAQTEAQSDPDLAPLRQAASKAFEKLLKKERKHP